MSLDSESVSQISQNLMRIQKMKQTQKVTAGFKKLRRLSMFGTFKQNLNARLQTLIDRKSLTNICPDLNLAKLSDKHWQSLSKRNLSFSSKKIFQNQIMKQPSRFSIMVHNPS